MLALLPAFLHAAVLEPVRAAADSTCGDRSVVSRSQQKLASFGAAFQAAPQTPSVASLRASLGLTRKLFSRLTGYSERAIAEWETGKEQSDSSQQRLTEIHRLRQALVDFIPPDNIGSWLLIPNESLGGFKPLEVIERGEIDRIWRLVHVANQPRTT